MGDVLKRVGLFDDSAEIALALREISSGNPDAYYEAEAAVHIEGMWELVNQMKKEIRKLRREKRG